MKVLLENSSLMKVEIIAECSNAFCNAFDLHLAIIDIETQFLQLKTGFTVSLFLNGCSLSCISGQILLIV